MPTASAVANKAVVRLCFIGNYTPTFDNTILALDRTGAILERVVPVFAALEESNSSPEMMEIAEQFYPLYQAHSDEMMMNDKLFGRVKYLYDHRDSLGLASDQLLAVEKMYKDFTRNGALLADADKEQLKAINSELADLYLKFNKNLLNATNAFSVVIDKEEDLAGLPESTIAVAAEEAEKRGEKGKWVFTLHAPSRLPVLQFAQNRDLAIRRNHISSDAPFRHSSNSRKAQFSLRLLPHRPQPAFLPLLP